jgi:hypothetical protein
VINVPPDHVREAIEEGQRIRGWIANGYAQVEYLLGDIIVRAKALDEYVGVTDRLPHRIERRITLVRQIVSTDGPFHKFRDEIESVICAFEQHHVTRNLLAHGLCTAFHTPNGDFGLEFRKWHRDGDGDGEMKRTFRLADLEYEMAQLVEVADRALHISRAIHSELGLVGQ